MGLGFLVVTGACVKIFANCAFFKNKYFIPQILVSYKTDTVDVAG